MTSPSSGKQWPIRVPVFARRFARDRIFGLFRQVFANDAGRMMAEEALRGLLRAGPPFQPVDPMGSHRAYPELGTPREDPRPAQPPIFITGRFRSGSTLLWNLFRHVDGCTSYYEPLNERRWFDPATRGERVDTTHVGVTNYWQEYDGLDVLGRWYDESWTERHLCMDASAWNPAMQHYVAALVDAAPGRAVLQFNRIDFRLAWFRATFPGALILHLFRHPRDQWWSSLLGRHFPLDGGVTEFPSYDAFYLLKWARDLKYRFPFLDENAVSHPYALFYYLWKLSYLFGVRYSDYSLCFEQLLRDPRQEIPALMRAVSIERYDLDRLTACVADQRSGKWRDYADDAWFAGHESECERTLAQFFGAAVHSASGAHAYTPARGVDELVGSSGSR